MAKMSADEKRWQAESDANTMMRYQEIMSDKRRMAAAQREAKRQADALAKRANAMKLASGGKLKK